MKTHFEEELEIEYNTVTELVTSAVLNGIIDRKIKDDFIQYIEMVRNKEMYYEPTDLKITDDGIEVPLTIKSLNGFLKQWIKESDYKKKILGITEPLRFEPTKEYEVKRFETTLNDHERLEVCNKIIADKGGKIIKSIDERLFIGIEEKHKQTLIYLLGGVRPTTHIKKINIKSQDVVYDLLYRISAHKNKNKNNETYVPAFVLKNICPETLEIKKTLKSNHSKLYDFLNKYLPQK